MEAKFELKTTDQLSDDEKQQLIRLFEHVFDRKKPLDRFNQQFLQTPLGFSFHSLEYVDGRIVGADTIVPYRYKFFGRDVLFGITVDTMIHPEHRKDPFALKTMADALRDDMPNHGVVFAITFPNENALEYRRRILKWTDIGELDYYALPIRLGKVVGKSRCVDWLFKPVAACIANRRRVDKTPCVFHIEKVNDQAFRDHRYGLGYHTVDCIDDSQAVYTFFTEDNDVEVAYILDVHPLNARTFRDAVKRIYQQVKGSADMILYVGHLPFRPRNMIKVPESRKPKHICMLGKVFDETADIDDRVFQLANWNVNISNFDVR